MEKEKFILNGDIQISEIDNGKPYIELTTRLCYLDYPNLNGIGLSSKADKESFDSLIDMPIVAKINAKGNKFGSHEVKRNKDGTISFSTQAYGVHTEVWVADDKVDIPNVGTKTVPCIFAKSKVWKRFENVCLLIENKINNPEKYNGGLFSSWELQGVEYNTDKGYKEYTKWVFLANTLIDVPPAYGKNSKTLEVAEQIPSFNELLSEAFEKDIKLSEQDNENINNKEEGGDVMEEKENVIVESEAIEELDKELINKEEEITQEEHQEEVEKSEEEISEEVEKETEENIESALNIRDLVSKISTALNPDRWDGDTYYSIQEIYPEEKKVMCVDLYSESSDEVYVFSYAVSNDEVSIGEFVKRKISELIAEKEAKISTLEKELSETKVELEKVTNEFNESAKAVSELMTEKSNLETQVAELGKYKEEAEKLEKAELDRQLEEKKTELSTFALEDELISEEELKEEKLATIFSELTLENFEDSKEKVEIFKSRKALAKFRAEKQGFDKEVQVSEVKNKDHVKTDLNNEDDDKMLSSTELVKKAFGIK